MKSFFCFVKQKNQAKTYKIEILTLNLLNNVILLKQIACFGAKQGCQRVIN